MGYLNILSYIINYLFVQESYCIIKYYFEHHQKKRFITSTFSLAILVCQGHILCEELFRGVRHNVRGAPKCNAAAGSPREPEIYGVMDDAFHNVI